MRLRTPSRRASAISETLLVIPLILLLLSLMFFLVTNIDRLQDVTAAGRYEAHRQALGARGPGDTPEHGDDLETLVVAGDDGVRGWAVESTDDNPLADGLHDAWLEIVGESAPAALGAGDAVGQLTLYLENLPGDRTVRTRLDHDDGVPLWSEVSPDGRVSHRASVLAGTWRFADLAGQAPNSYGGWYRDQPLPGADPGRPVFVPSLLAEAIHDTHYRDVADRLQDARSRGNVYAAGILSWLRGAPAYRGPDLSL